MEEVFPEMVARPKWKSKYRNLRVGDVGHVWYPKKVGEDSLRLARVIEMEPDTDDVVQMVTVGFHPRHVSDQGNSGKY